MIKQTTFRLFSVALLCLGLITGCASTEESSDSSLMAQAEQAIVSAKSANAEAKALNHEWRDTGSLIEQAEAKYADGDYAEAIKLANQAEEQSNIAIAQAAEENKKFLNSNADGSAIASSSSSRARGAGGRVSSYSVVRGDNLWSISGKDEVYADPYQWPLIYKTNRNKIKDADLILPGQVLDIDQNASASEIGAAINHAKTRGAWSVGDTEQSDSDYLVK